MQTKTKLTIDIQCASLAIEKSLALIASSALLRKWVKAATQYSGLITLRFVNQVEGKKLNFAFRNKDKPTNVLTFPYELSKTSLAADIVICLPVLKKEAKEQSKLLKDHLAHLIVHGCLHAQGHDHEVEKDAKKMENLEVRILKNLGFSNPYLQK
jgi:probable rRNA maturation factor